MSETETQGRASALPLSEAFPMFCNTSDDELYENMANAVRLGLPIINRVPHHNTPCMIVGGGPSLAHDLEGIRSRQKSGYKIFALNGAAHYLLENGIVADHLILLDARISNLPFVQGLDPKTKFYIASQCHPLIFSALAERDVTIWHPNMNGKSGVIDRRESVYIGGGTSVGMRALNLVEVLGYRIINLFGYDSSYSEANGHAYPQDQIENLENVSVGGKEFISSPWMIRQADDFQRISYDLSDKGCEITVHGYGLLPTVAKEMLVYQEPGTACYDLSRNPSSWDFLTWLVTAKLDHEQSGINEKLKICLPVGPHDGFRHGDVMDREQKIQLLENVIQPAIKALDCELIDGTAGRRYDYIYRPITDASLEGRAIPKFRASGEALEWAQQYKGSVVITLREASYWTQRNSDLRGWFTFAASLKDERVVFVRDTCKANEKLAFETCPEASLEFDKRLALSSVAKCNLMVSNGPVSLLYFGNAPFIEFKPPNIKGYAPSTAEWWEKFSGITTKQDFPWFRDDQRIVWKQDSAENIMAAWAEMQPPGRRN